METTMKIKNRLDFAIVQKTNTKRLAMKLIAIANSEETLRAIITENREYFKTSPGTWLDIRTRAAEQLDQIQQRCLCAFETFAE